MMDQERKKNKKQTMSQFRENRTFASILPVGLEAWLAGAEGVSAVHHAVPFIPVAAHRSVAAAVIQHSVCPKGNKQRYGQTDICAQWTERSSQLHTFLIAVDFIRAVVLTVVEVVAAQRRADAAAIRALELILLTNWWGSRCCWKTTGHSVVIMLLIKRERQDCDLDPNARKRSPCIHDYSKLP